MMSSSKMDLDSCCFCWGNDKLILTYCIYCSRALGDAGSAVSYFEESVEFLLKLPKDDLEVHITTFIV